MAQHPHESPTIFNNVDDVDCDIAELELRTDGGIDVLLRAFRDNPRFVARLLGHAELQEAVAENAEIAQQDSFVAGGLFVLGAIYRHGDAVRMNAEFADVAHPDQLATKITPIK